MHSDDENEREEPLERNGDPVRASVSPEMGAVVHDGGEKNADGDCKLVCANDQSTDPFGSGLGLVEWYCQGVVLA